MPADPTSSVGGDPPAGFGHYHMHFADISVFKWEKATTKHLDVVNEIAVKVLVAGMLGLKIRASIDTFVGHSDFPKKLVVDFADGKKHRRKAA